ncbi:cyclic-di-AMP-binding protein CbpB [Enterococcus columbae]|uniref:CBS domain-containing protein n=1 Tax=Enterococcus columbae DSM 7374 = ATCC 51263 TaxID=1121865 RepID=S1N3Z1_9ENTE|nr:cyclic-di-AMP-binding protein CbpB [Enterococcus columbae]EOT40537.1 hypothetical protein OMW_01399 [Enterococcus columbae DSM 7374 = ATCC 51263]EOW80313.1 hypothetical protein I568_02013 [Enterococcus columbae DSM 7374 = ATCC 51263]OJG25529.1 hypothetical protein RR47_GL001578 [Enterococcus columbae DSM 7374 = ATCC 51263]
MISKKMQAILLDSGATFYQDALDVATLYESHPLDHALLILLRTRYSKVPVLNDCEQLVGLIGIVDILNLAVDIEGLKPEKLKQRQVWEVMETDYPKVLLGEPLEKIFHLLVDQNFLAVVDEFGYFLGIITRKSVLKSVNHLLHTVEKTYDLQAK